MNWEEIDKIERETPKLEVKGRSKIAPSVQSQLDKFDKEAYEGTITEESFHQDNEKVVDVSQLLYFKKALTKTLRWQSLCTAIS